MEENTKKESILLQFSTDITELAKQDLLDPVIGREREIERVAQILSRRNKNNPVLIGEPGCVDGETIINVKKVSDDISHENVEIDF
jgi:ATP-dependent Clp protease ATP-binding subunit ClpA